MSVNADKLVQIVPRVIDTGTPGLAFNGLLLTQSDLPPVGQVLPFSSAQAVAAYFGDTSTEAALATQYFAGYVNADYLPSLLYIAPYSTDAVGAWLRGGAYEGTLAQLQAVTDGSLVISIDGTEKSLSGLDFSEDTSFSAVAQTIQTALTPAVIPATAGTLAGGVISAEYTAFQSVSAGKLNISIDGSLKELTDLDFGSVDSLTAVAQVIQTALDGAATVTLQSNNSLLITSATTGATSSVSYAANPDGEPEAEPQPSTDLAGSLGLTEATGAVSTDGTAQVQPVGPSVTYSSQTGAFQLASPTTGETSSVSYGADGTTGTGVASLLNLTQAGGAVQSIGREASTPAQVLTAITGVQRNWVSFTTTWEPELDEKMALAQWQAGYDTRFAYFEWDTDPAAKTPNSTASFAAQVNELALDGVVCHYNTAALAVAHMGLWASVNWDSQNGDIDPAFKSFEGLAVTCNNDGDYDALIANGYNCYADFATASAQFKFFQNGQCSGKWDWVDQYMCAIAIKDGLQLNILDLFSLVKTLPYTESGYAQVRTACLDTIEKFKRFGAIRAGVTLSQTQKVALLAEIGSDVSRTIETQGWYMQVKDPGATVRGQRGTPDCRFYYTDGGSIHQIIMPSTLIQ